MTELVTAAEASAVKLAALAKVQPARTFSNPQNARRAARAELGADARPGTDFLLVGPVAGRYYWEPTRDAEILHADPDDPYMLPASLRVENRKPLDAEGKAKVAAAMADAHAEGNRQAELRAAAKADKLRLAREKRAAKKEKAEAKERAEKVMREARTDMPLQGKEASAVLRKVSRANAKAEQKLADALTASVAGSGIAFEPVKREAPRKGSNKTALIADLARRPEGVTTAEVLAVTGWKAVNMPREIGKAGLKVRSEKKPGAPTRYFGA
jgi:hypothetical protein